MSDAGYGQMQPGDISNETTTVAFICRQIVSRLNTMKLVKVVAVYPGQGSPPATGTVDVQPLVSQIDGSGYATPHGKVSGLPYWAPQFGKWGIVAQPAVGDVGYVVCGDRDGSNVVRNAGSVAGPYNPGSRRQYDLADGVYMGGCLNAAPTQYLWLNPDGTFKLVDGKGNTLATTATGFNFTDTNGNVLESGSSGFTLIGNVTIQGNLEVEGDMGLTGVMTGEGGSGGTITVESSLHLVGGAALSASGGVTAGAGGGDQVGLQSHEHPTANTGSPSPPTPGT
jgi:hypothetical protein